MPKTQLCILCGGRSVEHEVSLQSARNVVSAADREQFDTTLVGISKVGQWHLYDPDDFLINPDDPEGIALGTAGPEVGLVFSDSDGRLVTTGGGPSRQIAVDVAFPVLHGSFGEDGAIQGAFDMAGIPYVGCDVAGSAVCMGKDLAKALLLQAGVPVADAVVVDAVDLGSFDPGAAVERLGLPLFVKPAKAGSSVGITKVTREADLVCAVETALRYDTTALVEQFVEGRELECAVLGNWQPRASVIGEVVSQDFYSYEAKYLNDDLAKLQAPAQLAPETTARFQDVAVRSFSALRCCGMARVDGFLTPAGRIVINEINTIPGFTNISMYPRLWQLSGLSYAELISELIRLALERASERDALLTEFSL